MFYNFLKSLIDFVGALLGLLVFSPVILILAILIMLESPGRPIFRQPRVTRNGKAFLMYKLRSMKVWGDSDQDFFKDNPELYKKYQANGWKLPLHEDPRVTRVGRFIRKTSLDELPQFWNVLMGEMSLVGPRAFRPEELEEQLRKFPEASENVKVMLSTKPGITGPWQVGSRDSVNFVERVRMDAEYAERESILYDLYIMVMTPFRVIHKER